MTVSISYRVSDRRAKVSGYSLSKMFEEVNDDWGMAWGKVYEWIVWPKTER